MRVFVAGATGVLGKRAVRLLVEGGHDVTAVARTPEKSALVESLGAAPVTVDLFDPVAVKGVVAAHDVVINLATHIPRVSRAAMPGAWDENDRIRREISRNLVDAAVATGATRYVQESISFAVKDGGDRWIDEDAPLAASAALASMLDCEASAARFTASGGVGIVLRFGLFYGPDSHTTQDMLRLARRGIAGMFGPDGYVTSINTDDAASAVVAALDAPAGIYNVGDEPMTRRDFYDAVAVALGTRPARLLPRRFGKLMGAKGAPFVRSQRVSSRRFRDATGWAPTYPSVREGLPQVVNEMGGISGGSGGPATMIMRAILAVLGLVSAELGIWATVAPRSFYDDFPGGGRHWILLNGPYNEHFIRDFGGLNLALALLLLVAAWKFTPTLVRTAAGAALLFGVPHFVYHARHADVFSGSDKAVNILLLGLSVLGPAIVLAWSFRKVQTPSLS
jgi:nucleoside-diphosphate-sugar epimerase